MAEKDFHISEKYNFRHALTVHGVSRERILPGKLTVKGNQLMIFAQFSVPLQDHDISIPKIVHKKIAEEIQVTVAAKLIKQSP